MSNKAILYEYLTADVPRRSNEVGYPATADNELIDEVSADDICLKDLPAGYNNTRPAVVFFRNAGEPGDVGEDSAMYTFRCYGGSDDALAAENVADAVIARLHLVSGETVDAGKIVSAECNGRMDWSDPDMRWPVVVLLFEVVTCDIWY